RGEAEHPVNRVLVRLYAPVVRAVVRRRGLVIAAALALLAATIPVALSLGTEFMPALDEGALLYMPTAPPGMSMTQATSVLQAVARELAGVPEVARVFGKVGRAETPTDPAGLEMVEAVVQLRPRGEWRPGTTRETLLRELDQRLRIPGMPNL